jgi:nucleoside-diphosphate-sugar epimerase
VSRGQAQRLLDSSRIAALGWRPTTRLLDGLPHTYAEAPFDV